MTIRLDFDWVEAAPSTDSLAQSTMAALTIDVEGSVVTSVLDRRSRSCRNHVVTSLGHVAQWLVGNWWRLFHEVADSRTPRPDFAETHDFACIGEGYLLPSLTIAPTPEKMSLRWQPYRPLHSALEFTEEGAALVDRDELEATFVGFLEAVLDRLANDPAAESLREEWGAVQAADEDEREFCRAAALLGRDPFATPQGEADQIIDFWNHTAASLREDALATANGNALAPLADWLTRTAQRVGSFDDGDWGAFRDDLGAFHQDPPRPAAQAPYRRGYDLAQAARAQLRPGALRHDLPTSDLEAVPCVTMQPPTKGIQGLVAAESPACAVANGRETTQRFLRARALGDYLGRAADAPAILSGLATDRQAQSRAFAAEFLAPAEALRRKLGGTRVSQDEVDDLAHEFDVSSYVVRHQIENHDLAQIADW